VNALTKTSWSPYAVGAGIGALSWFTFATVKKPLGVTTPFESTAAALGQRFAPRLSQANAYVAASDEVPKLDWEWMVTAGLVLGSFLSARASGDRDLGIVPGRWALRFGAKPSRRYLGAFLGGALMMFGARMAKGCTSGHGISGVMQLAASSWLFAPLMGASASLVARALVGKRGS
jgi:hypothetical protein